MFFWACAPFLSALGVQNWRILVYLGVRAKSSIEERVFSWLLEDKQAYTRQEKEKKIPGREQHEQTWNCEISIPGRSANEEVGQLRKRSGKRSQKADSSQIVNDLLC